MKAIRAIDRECIRDELVVIAERLAHKYQYTVQESRRKLHELVDVSV